MKTPGVAFKSRDIAFNKVGKKTGHRVNVVIRVQRSFALFRFVVSDFFRIPFIVSVCCDDCIGARYVLNYRYPVFHFRFNKSLFEELKINCTDPENFRNGFEVQFGIGLRCQPNECIIFILFRCICIQCLLCGIMSQ